MPRHENQTAQTTYQQRTERMEDQIRLIRAHLSQHSQDKITWAHVGDMAYINEQLDNILETFLGEPAH